MSVNHSTDLCKPSSNDLSPLSGHQLAEQLQQTTDQLRALIPQAAQLGDSFDQTERTVRDMLRTIGNQAMQLLLTLQGDGDLGKQTVTDDGTVLHRSQETATTSIRSIFGQHTFQQYVYSTGKNKAIELRPISARIELPTNRWSYLLQEISQVFSAEAAYNQASDQLELVLGGQYSVDTLETINLSMGVDAGQFLEKLPKPDTDKEAEILVATADCKGVPLLKEDAEKVKAFQTSKKRPGNRRMATVASVYSVAAYQRSPESILEALFRDEAPQNDETEDSPKRPSPHFKQTTAHFPRVVADAVTDESLRISGIHAGVGWISEQVELRRQAGQTLVVVMDGQEALWDTSAMHFDDSGTIEILDLLHVAVYVWEAASLFHSTEEAKEAFTRDRLARLLDGDVKGVIRGLRRMGTMHELAGKAAKDCQRIAGYFEKHSHRMKYDQYIGAGYPIASGVIEGACRHLVKDRMERSGMRWTLEGARSMLNVRAAFQSDYWTQFHHERKATLNRKNHLHKALLVNYSIPALAC